MKLHVNELYAAGLAAYLDLRDPDAACPPDRIALATAWAAWWDTMNRAATPVERRAARKRLEMAYLRAKGA